MEDKEQNVNLTGFDIELQSLPMVASSLAMIDVDGKPQEVKVIIEKSRKYLNLLFDNAIKKNTKTV